MDKKAMGRILFLLIILGIIVALGLYGNSKADTCVWGWKFFCWKW